MFPNMKYILTIFRVTTITTASVERPLSSLKRIKNSHTIDKNQKRHNSLKILHINKYIQVKPQKKYKTCFLKNINEDFNSTYKANKVF